MLKSGIQNGKFGKVSTKGYTIGWQQTCQTTCFCSFTYANSLLMTVPYAWTALKRQRKLIWETNLWSIGREPLEIFSGYGNVIGTDSPQTDHTVPTCLQTLREFMIIRRAKRNSGFLQWSSYFLHQSNDFWEHSEDPSEIAENHKTFKCDFLNFTKRGIVFSGVLRVLPLALKPEHVTKLYITQPNIDMHAQGENSHKTTNLYE